MLDEINQISSVDKSNMLDTIAQLPNQIKESLEIANNVIIENFIKIDNIIITGMGASGISGDVISHLFRDKIDVPIYVNKEPDLPKWAKKNTLTIFISYSGETEETLSSFKIASQKKCKAVTISSGGKLQDLSEKRGISHIKVPSGYQPRAAIAYLLFPIIIILQKTGILKNKIDQDIDETVNILEEIIKNNNKSISVENNLSKQIAESLYNTIPQIYGWGFYNPIATRWKTQFNENSKLISRVDFIPECNHNDIVGWSFDNDLLRKFSTILFRDKDEESVYLSNRIEFMKRLFEGTVSNIIEIYPKGKSRLAKMLYTMCLGDFVSCYLAILRNIDPSPIDAITELKNHLSNI